MLECDIGCEKALEHLLSQSAAEYPNGYLEYPFLLMHKKHFP